MTKVLDYADIQGNVTRAYGRYSFPFARYVFLHIDTVEAGRRFVDQVRPRVTTATLWDETTRPEVTLNIGFTFPGLLRLGVPTRTLQRLPNPFIDGMKARAFLLGDRDQTLTEAEARRQDWCAHWDPIWQASRDHDGDGADDVHIWISMNARAAAEGRAEPHGALEAQTEWLRGLCAELDRKVRILATNGPKGEDEYQEASAVFHDLGGGHLVPTPREHFGLTDGIGNPVFAGQYPDPAVERRRLIGRGKWMSRDGRWEPLATGEFLLGHPDESQEIPPATVPSGFSNNATFMVYRKLHQNVGSWRDFVASEATGFARAMGIDEAEARETLVAKMVGRWSDGVPLSLEPTYAEWRAYRRKRGLEHDDPAEALKAQNAFLSSDDASDFRFGDDMAGIRCPVGSHLRRVNTRDYLDPLNEPGGRNRDATTQLNKRRRILRRGLPYGDPLSRDLSDETEQGIAFMAVGASLFRQFEFVQQQWIQYGLDFNEGNNTCPLIGDHRVHDRYPIPADPAGDKPAYIVSRLKTFVETRGGDYFFLPSLSCLSLIAMGAVDPT
ncbi:MAG: Dyp-type peroxidase [Paracoccaceae bacterium]